MNGFLTKSFLCTAYFLSKDLDKFSFPQAFARDCGEGTSTKKTKKQPFSVPESFIKKYEKPADEDWTSLWNTQACTTEYKDKKHVSVLVLNQEKLGSLTEGDYKELTQKISCKINKCNNVVRSSEVATGKLVQLLKSSFPNGVTSTENVYLKATSRKANELPARTNFLLEAQVNAAYYNVFNRFEEFERLIVCQGEIGHQLIRKASNQKVDIADKLNFNNKKAILFKFENSSMEDIKLSESITFD